MDKYMIEELHVDGIERKAVIRNNLSERLVVYFVEPTEYLESNEFSKIKKVGDFLEGNIEIDCASVIRKTNVPLMYKQPIFNSYHIEAVVEVVEVIDEFSLYAITSIIENKVLVDFDEKVSFNIKDRIFIDGCLSIY